MHARPPAFEGVDGLSYSVEIITDETGDRAAPWGAYLFFVRWGTGEPEVKGHLETEFIVRGASEAVVRRDLGAMPLASVKATLDALIRAAQPPADARPWWDVARTERGEDDAGPGTP